MIPKEILESIKAYAKEDFDTSSDFNYGLVCITRDVKQKDISLKSLTNLEDYFIQNIEEYFRVLKMVLDKTEKDSITVRQLDNYLLEELKYTDEDKKLEKKAILHGEKIKLHVDDIAYFHKHYHNFEEGTALLYKGSYLGEVIRKELEGKWFSSQKNNDKDPLFDELYVEVDGKKYYPFSLMENFLINPCEKTRPSKAIKFN